MTRNTIGTMATTAAAFVAMLVITTLPHIGRWTPASWVQGWMGFPVGLRSITALPNNFWSRFITAGGSPPSHLLGLTGLTALLVATTAVALRIFTRSDIADRPTVEPIALSDLAPRARESGPFMIASSTYSSIGNFAATPAARQVLESGGHSHVGQRLCGQCGKGIPVRGHG
jgi:hypothetical protein